VSAATLTPVQGRDKGEDALLDEEGQAELREALLGPPPGGGMWSGPKESGALDSTEERGLEKVHAQRGWEYLRKVRMSPQVPMSPPIMLKGPMTLSWRLSKVSLPVRLKELKRRPIRPKAKVELCGLRRRRAWA
jgi:hypothetical protein